MPDSFTKRKSNREPEMFARAVLKLIIHGTYDPEKIRKRALFMAQALDCPSATCISFAHLAEILGISRQATYAGIDAMACKLAQIKSEIRDDG